MNLLILRSSVARGGSARPASVRRGKGNEDGNLHPLGKRLWKVIRHQLPARLARDVQVRQLQEVADTEPSGAVQDIRNVGGRAAASRLLGCRPTMRRAVIYRLGLNAERPLDRLRCQVLILDAQSGLGHHLSHALNAHMCADAIGKQDGVRLITKHHKSP